MMEYYGIRTKDDPDGEYLQHWGLSKGAMKKGHKYLARLVTPSGYRYIYDQAQLAAAKAGKAISSGLNDARRGVQSAVYRVRRNVRNTTGIGLKEQAQKASARAQRITQNGVGNARMALKARQHAKKVQSQYNNSLLGRAERAVRNARSAAISAGKQSKRNLDNTLRSGERAAQKLVRSTSQGRALDDQLGVTKQGRHNKKNATYKQASLERRYRASNGMIDDNRRTLSKYAAKESREYGNGANNASGTALKGYLNAHRPSRRNTSANHRKRNARLRSDLQENRVNNAAPNSGSNWTNSSSSSKKTRTPISTSINRHGVDSALNLLRTGQGIDQYNITKRAGEYRKKVKKRKL